jgi:hypothetical protein
MRKASALIFGKVEQFLDAREETTMKADYVWNEPYRAAILETDDAKLPNRLKVAKAAIDARLHEWQSDHGGPLDERQAISDALAGLTVLRAELEGRSQSAVCRICKQPIPRDDCKLDESGKAVHESCYVEEVRRLVANRSKSERERGA